jgi:hypothetical protein
MSVFGVLLRVVLMPVIRPLVQFRTSAQSIKAGIARARAAALAKQGHGEASEGLSEQSRFEALYTLNGWDMRGLREQHVAASKTKMAASYLALLLLLAVPAALMVLPGFTCLIVSAICLSASMLAFLQAVRFGLMQMQIEQRALSALRSVLGRSDLLRFLFTRSAVDIPAPKS